LTPALLALEQVVELVEMRCRVWGLGRLTVAKHGHGGTQLLECVQT
jgi:hypothetical protein